MVNEGQVKLHVVPHQWLPGLAQILNDSTEAKLKFEESFHLLLLLKFGLGLFLSCQWFLRSWLVIRIFCDLLFGMNFFNIVITETEHGGFRHHCSTFATQFEVLFEIAISLIAATH